MRLALERCGYGYHRPCLILSVDGFLTIRIPTSRKVAGIFLPSTETEMTEGDKARIGRIYEGPEWRALARGKNPTWHAIAGAPTEAAVVEAALQSCTQADENCQIHAIGNFRVSYRRLFGIILPEVSIERQWLNRGTGGSQAQR